MKIVYYSDTSLADCDFPLVKAWQQLGHEVYFFIEVAKYNLHKTIIDINEIIAEDEIIPAKRYKELRIFSQYMSLDYVYVINKYTCKEISLNNLKLYLKFSNQIKKINPDVIVSTGPLGFAASMLWRFRNKLRFIIHDPFPHTGEKTLKNALFRKICFSFAKGFILLNPNQANKFANMYHIDARKILVTKFAPYEAFSVLCSHASLPQDFNNVLFFGRISPYKGIEYLLEAMKKVHEVIPQASLTIAGNGKYYFDKISYEKLTYIKIINRFIPVIELASLLKQCAFVCCPYTDATQSGVVMTSYALEKPILASNVGGLSSQIINGKTGLLISPKDSDELANNIILLLQNRKLLQEMSYNIHEKYFEVNSKYSWQSIAIDYLEFFKKSI